MSEDRISGAGSTPWDRHEELFLHQMRDCLDRGDFTEYSSHRETPDKLIHARSRVYQGEKLDRVMVNQYSLRHGRGGLVIFGYPRVEYDIPSLLLHVGGMPPTKTLLTLDLAPSSSTTPMGPFQVVAQAQRTALALPDTPLEWLRPVTSPHLLHCAFKPLDPEHFLATLAATLDTWRRDYIEPAAPDTDPASIQARTDRILEMKKVIFRNDPAFPVFTRTFGQTMSDVFAEAAFGGHPGLSIAEAREPPPAPGSWFNKKLGVGWNADAQERVHEAPAFLRPIIRRIIEKEAVKEETTQVTLDLVLLCEKKYRGGMEL